MRIFLCVLVVLSALQSNAQKLKEVSLEDFERFQNLKNSFSYTVQNAREHRCCFEDSLISKNYILYYQYIYDFLLECKPGKNIYGNDLHQIVFLVGKIDYIINASIDTELSLSNSRYVRKIGFTSYEHWFFLNEINTIMSRKTNSGEIRIKKKK